MTDRERAEWDRFVAFTARGIEYDRSLGVDDFDPHFTAIVAVDARLALLEAEHRAGWEHEEG